MNSITVDPNDNKNIIQKNIDKASEKCSAANDIIFNTNDEKMKSDLIAKNERREDTIASMKGALDKKNGLK